MNKIIIIFMACLLQLSCVDKDKCHRFVTYKNNSAQTVLYIHSCDTLLSKVIVPFDEPVNAKSEGGEHLNTTCAEGFIKNCPNEKITYFFIDANVKNNTSWDSIRLQNKILGRKMFSVADMNNNGWTVTYP